MPIGRMTLNKGPENYFQEVEQSAFNPSNFVPGIGPSPDKLLQGRLYSYHDTHLHRLGLNYHLIPVNQPKNAVAANYHRDGFHNTREGDTDPVYWPNSFGGPAPSGQPEPGVRYGGEAGRFVQPPEDVDYKQPRALYRDVMTEEEREPFIGNVADALGQAIERIRMRSVVMFWKMDEDCGQRLAKAVQVNAKDAERLSRVSFDELVKATAE